MIAEAAAGATLTKDFFQFLSFIKGIVGADVISSYHRYDGTRVEGSKKIAVELITSQTSQCPSRALF